MAESEGIFLVNAPRHPPGEPDRDQVAAVAAELFPPSLRKSPLVDDAVDDAIAVLQKHPADKRQVEQVVRNHVNDQLNAMGLRVRSFAAAMTARHHWQLDVDDVWQEVFLLICRMQKSFDPAVQDKFWSWVFGVAKNVMRHLARKEIHHGQPL